jgi:hypothetical protein
MSMAFDDFMRKFGQDLADGAGPLMAVNALLQMRESEGESQLDVLVPRLVEAETFSGFLDELSNQAANAFLGEDARGKAWKYYLYARGLAGWRF